MRAGWPQLIFISTALHVIVGAAILLPSLGYKIGTPANAAPAPTTVTFLLRSEPSTAPVVVAASSARPSPVPKHNGLPVLASKSRTAGSSSADVAALALKDRAVSRLRSASVSVLHPSVPPSVDPRAGVVFVLDISGSMYESYAGSTRLALARGLLAQRIRDLRDGTPFAVTVYGESARRSGPLVPANAQTRAAAIAYLYQEYDCGGGTNLPVGLALAEELQMGAVVLATDGDLNMTAAELLPDVHRILGGNGTAPSFTVLAVGPRANTDAEKLLQELADQQGGTYQCLQGGSMTAANTTLPANTGTP